MKKEDKAKVVEELTERLRASDTLLVADYRGLTMPQIDALRSKLIESGAKFSVVKNTLGRRAAEAAGSEALLTLLEGPSAIAFLEADGDMVAAAKALADVARDSKILAIRGGVLQGRAMSAEEVETLAKLPPVDVLRGQVLGAIIAPLTALLGIVTAPLQNLHGLIDARIEQLEAQGDTSGQAAPAAEPAAEEPVAAAEPQAADEADTPADATASAAEDASTEETDSTETEES
ncbi:MAG TPA: 50S ribosomal protein L10 [Gaiellaceae bacterium]|nr:50S ribosomal protein L10 [Gaiellaceae bacterium]